VISLLPGEDEGPFIGTSGFGQSSQPGVRIKKKVYVPFI